MPVIGDSISMSKLVIEKLDSNAVELLLHSIRHELSRVQDSTDGITIKLGRATYSSTQIKMSVVIHHTKAKNEELIKILKNLNIAPDNESYNVVEYRPSNRKYPWIVERKEDGFILKVSTLWLKHRLPRFLKKQLLIGSFLFRINSIKFFFSSSMRNYYCIFIFHM